MCPADRASRANWSLPANDLKSSFLQEPTLLLLAEMPKGLGSQGQTLKRFQHGNETAELHGGVRASRRTSRVRDQQCILVLVHELMRQLQPQLF